MSLVLIVKDQASTVEKTISAWMSVLSALGREWEMLVVDDGSTDGTAAKAAAVCAKTRNVRVLAASGGVGPGRCLRAALPEARFPILALVVADYPYTPGDLGNLLDKIGTREIIHDREFEVVLANGCRSGVPVPTPWRLLGVTIRLFARLALGLPLSPLAGWLGLREHFRSWYAWFVFGNPFIDPNCGLKAIRKSLLESFPIQSDGDFVHVEIIAKTTFLTNLTAEVPLTPKAVPVPSPVWSREDRKRLLYQPQFRQSVAPTPSPAAAIT